MKELSKKPYLASKKRKDLDIIYKEIETIDNKRIKEMGDLWGISRIHMDLQDFFDYVFEFFELDKFMKKRLDFDYDDEEKFYEQKHKAIKYMWHLLEEIKPFLLLNYRLAELTETSEMFEKEKIKEESVVNMLDNFLNLYRSGRKRKISDYTLERFKKFKQDYNLIIEFFQELNTPEIRSINDYAQTIIKHKVTLKQLRQFKSEYKLKFRDYIRECSERTLYRYDKDFIFMERTYRSIKWLEFQWSNYRAVDPEYFS